MLSAFACWTGPWGCLIVWIIRTGSPPSDAWLSWIAQKSRHSIA